MSMATNTEQPRRDRDDRYERLVEAARYVWLGARHDWERPHLYRMVVNREALDALGDVLAEF